MGQKHERPAFDPNRQRTVPKNAVLYEAFGEKRTLVEWSRDERCIVRRRLLDNRVHCLGWSLEKAMTTPIDRTKRFNVRLYEEFGESKTLVDWASDPRCKVPYDTLVTRIHSRMPLAKALSAPIRSHLPVELGEDGKYSYAYRTWHHMHTRCNNKKDRNYKHYGGRGIAVCSEWAKGQPNEQGLLNFLLWVEQNPRPSKGHSLDRRDNDEGYSPSNCRWATRSEQSKNRRNVAYYERKLEDKNTAIKFLWSQLPKGEPSKLEIRQVVRVIDGIQHVLYIQKREPGKQWIDVPLDKVSFINSQ